MRGRPRRLRVVVVAAAALLGGGCVTTGPLDYVRNGFKVGPNYCKPPAPAAGEWIEADDPRVERRHLEDWWGVFNDPALNSLVQTAYEQNLNLRVLAPTVKGFVQPQAWVADFTKVTVDS